MSGKEHHSKLATPSTITVSIGVSEMIPRPHQQNDEAMSDRILADADAALYQAKVDGRNRVAQYPGPKQSRRRSVTLDKAGHEA